MYVADDDQKVVHGSCSAVTCERKLEGYIEFLNIAWLFWTLSSHYLWAQEWNMNTSSKKSLKFDFFVCLFEYICTYALHIILKTSSKV